MVDTSWQAGESLASALANVDTLVHLAAHVHVRGKGFSDLDEFKRVNTDATIRLAEEAARCGVRRFVFMSSIGVLGGASTSRPFREDQAPHPHNAYVHSKWLAERGLENIKSMDVVILRPPAVVGAGARGNLRSIMNALSRGLPLPFASIRNARQFVTLNNLVDAIMLGVSSESAAGGTFHVANPEEISTPQLCRELADVIGVAPRLWHFPPTLLEQGLSLVGRRSIGMGLTRDLLIDTTRAREILGWQARESLHEGLRELAGVAK